MIELEWQDIDEILRLEAVLCMELRHFPYRSKEYCSLILEKFLERKNRKK